MINNSNKIIAKTYKALSKITSAFDKTYLAKDVPMANIASHANWREYLYSVGNKKGMRILEIGSREVTGKSTDRQKFNQATYVGFDYYSGNNVDVVGDVHKLSTYFDEDNKFDIIYSSACFEHFAMPWVVAQEISKLLKVDGLVFVETHFSYSSHERPWHFFQFSDIALKVLFNKKLGFECIDTGMSNPIVGRFSKYADQYLRYKRVPALYCHVGFLGKKVAEVSSFNWNEVETQDIVDNTYYPSPEHTI